MKYLAYYENGEIISIEDYKEAAEKLKNKNKNKKETIQKFLLHKYIFTFCLDEVKDASEYSLCKKKGETHEVYLEKKNVQGNLICKQRETISEEEGSRILNGEIAWMKEDERPLVRDFYLQSTLNGLEYSHMMDFEREVYHYEKQDYVVFDKAIRRQVDQYFLECLFEDDVQVRVRRAKTIPRYILNMLVNIEPASEQWAYA